MKTTKDNIRLLSEDQGNLKVICVVKNCLHEIEGKTLGEVVLNFAKHYQKDHQYK